MTDSTLNPLDPAHFKVDPYALEYQPYPLADDLRRMGVFPVQSRPVSLDNPGEAVHVQTRIPPVILFAIDRIVERRLWSFKSRTEVFRTAVVNFVHHMADLIQQDQVGLAVWRLNQQRQTLAELERLNNFEEMVACTRKVARKFLDMGAHIGAIQALRGAKRYMEDIPFPTLRDRFEIGVYGGEGMVMPSSWHEDEVAVLWGKVLEGELDREDEEQVREQTKLA
jgi:hypothetical protein